MKDVRILLLGEPSVGKTSLVLSLVSEGFSAEVPAKAEEITIPADITPEKVPTIITDYSVKECSTAELCQLIVKSDVICVVYDITNEITIKQIGEYWLPLIRKSYTKSSSTLSSLQRVPVVIVGNKSDLCPQSRLDLLLPIMNQFSEVETCIECSAKKMHNISETFWFAQKAVLYPTAPIYSSDTKTLTPQCIEALTRIFKICDLDNDGFLNDKELEIFQQRCFKIPLHPQSLQDVKDLLKKSCSDGFQLQGFTLRGFLFLHQVFVQKGRHETIWAVLRYFGYNQELRLSDEVLHPNLSVSYGCTTELSGLGLHFLQLLFDKYDCDRDGCLCPEEFAALISLASVNTIKVAASTALPGSGTYHHNPTNSTLCDPELNNSVVSNHLGWLTKQGFIAKLVLLTYMEPVRALECLACTGFTYQSDGQSLLSAIQVTREKRVDLHRRQTSRQVFHCRVFGSKRVGKSCFLQALLGHDLQYTAMLGRNQLPCVTCNSVVVYGQEKHLILEEQEWARAEQLHEDEAVDTDVVCLLFDITDPSSFKYVADIYLNYYRGTKIPCLIVATKSEQVEIPQYYPLDPSEFASKYRLPEVQKFSCIESVITRKSMSSGSNEADIPDLFVKLAIQANYPHLKGMQLSQGDYSWKFGLAATVLAGFGFVAFRIVRTHL